MSAAELYANHVAHQADPIQWEALTPREQAGWVYAADAYTAGEIAGQMRHITAEMVRGDQPLDVQEELIADLRARLSQTEAILADRAASTVQADDGLRERIKVSRDLPFSFRMPTNRADNADGQALNAGAQYVDVQVVHEPDLPVRGECRPGYGGTVIALREWDEQVFLHEMIHAATDYAQPHLNTTHPPHGHDIISRIEVALWESGWRFQPSASTVQADDGLSGYEAGLDAAIEAICDCGNFNGHPGDCAAIPIVNLDASPAPTTPLDPTEETNQ